MEVICATFYLSERVNTDFQAWEILQSIDFEYVHIAKTIVSYLERF